MAGMKQIAGFALALFLFPVLSVIGGSTEPQHPCPGITYYTETRTNPPMRLFVAEVDLRNPKVHVRVAPGGPDPDGPGKWQTTLMRPTKIANRENFNLVVNGDFFAARNIKDAEGTNSRYSADVWASVEGPAVTDGRIWSQSISNRPCLVVHKDRSVDIEMLSHPVEDDFEVISGNQMLVKQGKVLPHRSKTRNPRTVVGLNADGTKLVILVVDGRKPGVSIGMSYEDMGAEMLRLGCRQALNLDGGGSSVMAVRDPSTGEMRILNTPSDGHERPVANTLGVFVN
jgi:exopolysaccharide biosynthesis protein